MSYDYETSSFVCFAGPVNKFLSWKGFMPLSRLTYCSYLIHPLVIWWFIGTQDVLFHYSIPMVMMLLLGKNSN